MCLKMCQGLFLIHHQKAAFSHLLYLFIWKLQLFIVPLPPITLILTDFFYEVKEKSSCMSLEIRQNGRFLHYRHSLFSVMSI